MTQKVDDSVIEEIHRTREEISERFDGNIAAIAEDAARCQAASGRPVWKPETPNGERGQVQLMDRFPAHSPNIWLQATQCRDAVWLLGNFQAQCHAALGA